MDRIETINFHEEKDVRGVRFWAYNAGHVLGAAMFMIEIAGVKVCAIYCRFLHHRFVFMTHERFFALFVGALGIETL